MARNSKFLSRQDIATAIINSLRRLHPLYQLRNPVMFVVYIGAIMTTVLAFYNPVSQPTEPGWFVGAIAAWLWFTVLFANFAEAAKMTRWPRAIFLRNPALVIGCSPIELRL